MALRVSAEVQLDGVLKECRQKDSYAFLGNALQSFSDAPDFEVAPDDKETPAKVRARFTLRSGDDMRMRRGDVTASNLSEATSVFTAGVRSSLPGSAKELSGCERSSALGC